MSTRYLLILQVNEMKPQNKIPILNSQRNVQLIEIDRNTARLMAYR